ncbi:MAG TPA: amidohydrolase [Bacillota bacterium]|nr:amidohydrolase [Bacillota bacterium]
MTEHIFQLIDDHFQEMVDIRRYLHERPELSFEEHETAKYISQFYEQLNIPYETNVGGNGIIATLEGGKEGKTIGLRADFDALPIQDEKDVSYKSKNDGVMHACGHDGHTAILLTIAKVLTSVKDELKGTVVFIHQHAEELAPGGAKPMMASGKLDHIDAFFGSHLWVPTPLGTIDTTKGNFMAGVDRFEITIQGKGGHGAAPHETKDSIVIGADVVSQIQQIVSRRIDPLETAVVTIGSFQSGNAFNIIADTAKIVGTVRYFNRDVQETIMKEMKNILQGLCVGSECSHTLSYEKGYPPVINHEDDAELIMTFSEQIKDVKEVREVPPTMGGEDFAYYILNHPGAYFFTGAQKEGHVYPHHHPLFDFDERAMPIAAKALIQAYLNYQEK